MDTGEWNNTSRSVESKQGLSQTYGNYPTFLVLLLPASLDPARPCMLPIQMQPMDADTGQMSRSADPSKHRRNSVTAHGEK